MPPFSLEEYHTLRRHALECVQRTKEKTFPDHLAPTYKNYVVKSLQDSMVSLRRNSVRG